MSMCSYETFAFSDKSEDCYGLEIVRRHLADIGIQTGSIDYSTISPVLVSLYWIEHIYPFIRWRFQARMQKKRVIVGGNYATTSPSALLPFCDAVFLGDGEEWSGLEESEYIITKDSKATMRAIAAELLPVSYIDLQETRRSFIEISRGCKNKCMFCQYGWLKRYREASIVDIIESVKLTKTKTLKVVSADRFQHSRYFEFRRELIKIGKMDSGSDMTVLQVLKRPELLDITEKQKTRVGIEGMSYRLRKMVGKNLTDEQLIEFGKKVAASGKKNFNCYMIYGLPTEEEADIEEFQALVRKFDEALPTGFAICIHWNAFNPAAQTPFQWAAAAPIEYPRLAKMLASFGNRRIKIYSRPRMTGRWTLIRRVLAIRGSEKSARLLFSVATNEAKFRKNPDLVLRHYHDLEGIDLMGPWPIDEPLPWDRYCRYERDRMMKNYLLKTGQAKSLFSSLTAQQNHSKSSAIPPT